jgi:hypothetical protein
MIDLYMWECKDVNGLKLKPLGDIWLISHRDDIPNQGWKIHVSCLPENLNLVLRRLAPLLHNESFKIARSPNILAALNAGRLGKRVQAKALTIYTQSESRFIELTPKIHALLVDLWGPSILTDKRFKRGSCVYYRYGANSRKSDGLDRWGRRWSTFRDLEEQICIDHPTECSPIPSWLGDPFCSHSQEGSDLNLPGLGSLYRTVNDVLKYGTRPVLRVTGINGTTLILKATNLDSLQERLRLDHEMRILNILSSGDLIPKVVDVREAWPWCLVFYEDAGADFRHQRLFYENAEVWLDTLLALVESFHAKGLVLGDLSPANVAFSKSGIKYVDLEHVMLMGLRSPRSAATQGYEGFHEPSHWRQDVNAAGRMAIHAWSGLDMRCVPHIRADNVHLILTGAPKRFIEQVAQAVSYQPPPVHMLRRIPKTGCSRSSAHCREDMKASYRCLGHIVSGVVRGLVEEARTNGGYWPSACNRLIYARDTLALGDIGPAWFLLQECAPGDEGFELACAVIDRARKRRDLTQDGLYSGPFGYILADLHRGIKCHDNDRIRQVVDEIISLSQSPISQLDILAGFSGRLAVLNLASSELKDSRLQCLRLACAEQLASCLVESEETLTRAVGKGASGILGAILVLRQSLNKSDFDRRVSELEKRIISDLESTLNTLDGSWCKGAVGLGIHLLSCHTSQPTSKLHRDTIALIVEYLNRIPLSNMGMCHGLAGILRFSAIAKGRNVCGADSLMGTCLGIFHSTKIEFHAGFSWLSSKGKVDSSFFNGASGIGFILSRIHRGILPFLPHEESCLHE